MKNVVLEATGMHKNFWVTPETAAYYADKLCDCIQDNVKPAGAKGVVIGMSGGLDSAFAGALCSRAGIDVHAVMLPCNDSMRTSGSWHRAHELCEKFGWKISVHDIGKSCAELRSSPQNISAASPRNAQLAEMNLQARLRVAKMREIAQLEDRFVLGTDNLTEYIYGYFTKDGNGCDLRPFVLFTKRELYIMAPVIGVVQSIISAIPSAELFVGQTDEAELGFTYAQGDDFIQFGTCGDPAIDAKILKTIYATQHKRIAPPFFDGY